MDESNKKFLKKLKKDLEKQGLNPCVWSISEQVWVKTMDGEQDAYHYLDKGANQTFETFSDLKKHLIAKFKDAISDDGKSIEERVETIYEVYIDSTTDDLDLLLPIYQNNIERIPMIKIEKIKNELLFLTEADAKKHLEDNYYFYDLTAKPFKIEIKDSVRIKKLFDILMTEKIE
jgi:hypothetical protein